MLHRLRAKLRKFAVLHNIYMRLKRAATGELLGMTTRSEQEYFRNYGKNLYSGRGAVVDLGCWMGSTTIPLASGLAENIAFVGTSRKIYAYDTFIWYDVMKGSVAGTDLVGKYRDGDSFLDEYRKRTSKYAPIIEIRPGDLKEIGWNDGEIEFLLVDAMKNWDLSNAIIKDFYRQLIPGTSLVLQQDFAHYFTPWIHLIHWKLRRYFEFVEEIPRSSSVVFRLVAPIPPEILDCDHSFDSFTDSDLRSAIDHSLSFVSEEKTANIYAAEVMSYIHQRRIADAANKLNEILAKGVALDDDLVVVRDLIRESSVG